MEVEQHIIMLVGIMLKEHILQLCQTHRLKLIKIEEEAGITKAASLQCSLGGDSGSNYTTD
jgi:hypothetical protein